ncbi:MAG: prephenate dehydrogenase/arogenate dehydrogenase family protein [Eggerthellaceae bacterium]|nr:prephenate dehydrogenase/arogenate dehydrogenase family protein [Eggerthellaceae bacterium]
MKDTIHNIAVIGLGLIGASFAGACKAANPEIAIFGVDVLPESVGKAVEKGWVDRAVLPDDPAFEEYVENSCDLVVVATPPLDVGHYFEKLAAWDYTGIVTDTASTKSRISSMAKATLKYPSNYVPGHPMTGSEKNGIEGASPELFQGTYWILCPDEDTPAEHFQVLHELFTSLGARVISLPRQDHDEAVAIVSHVPHIIASSLVQLACRHADDQQALLRLAAGGFKDSTRIAAGSPDLWCGISFDNAEALRAGLAEIQQIISQFEDSLEKGDQQQMTRLLKESAEARRNLPAAWIPSTEQLLEVRIPMRDRKGVVAEVTTIASQVGCNIQSIEIDHVTESSAVLNLILTDEGDIGQLSAQLLHAGFSVSFSPLSPKEYSHVE